MHFIVFALLAGAAVTAASEDQGSKQVCEPGKLFKNYCNDCKCANDGLSAVCTLMLCSPDYNQDGSRNDNSDVNADIVREKRQVNGEVEKKVCEPGKLFKNYCNDCKCANDGLSAVCTLMLCSPDYNQDGSRNDNLDVNADIVREKRQVSGEVEKKICEPGKLFMNYCNGCRCADDGLSAACTLMHCSSDYNKDGSRKVDSDVNADIVREKRQVNGEVEKKMCEPGKLFMNYCNGCICGNDGLSAACTLMHCSPDYNKDGSRNVDSDVNADIVREKREVSGEVEKKICEPGKPFKYYCNHCVCSKKGTSAGCTKMYCPPGLFNEDGTTNF